MPTHWSYVFLALTHRYEHCTSNQKPNSAETSLQTGCAYIPPQSPGYWFVKQCDTTMGYVCQTYKGMSSIFFAPFQQHFANPLTSMITISASMIHNVPNIIKMLKSVAKCVSNVSIWRFHPIARHVVKHVLLPYLFFLVALVKLHEPLFLLQWASYQIRKIAGCACAGNVFPATAC